MAGRDAGRRRDQRRCPVHGAAPRPSPGARCRPPAARAGPAARGRFTHAGGRHPPLPAREVIVPVHTVMVMTGLPFPAGALPAGSAAVVLASRWRAGGRMPARPPAAVIRPARQAGSFSLLEPCIQPGERADEPVPGRQQPVLGHPRQPGYLLVPDIPVMLKPPQRRDQDFPADVGRSLLVNGLDQVAGPLDAPVQVHQYRKVPLAAHGHQPALQVPPVRGDLLPAAGRGRHARIAVPRCGPRGAARPCACRFPLAELSCHLTVSFLLLQLRRRDGPGAATHRAWRSGLP